MKKTAQRRAFERVSSRIEVRFCCCDTDYCGTVTDISEKGMFISTDRMCFPFDSYIDVVIHSDHRVLKVPVYVRRMRKTTDVYDGIGVELADPPPEYLDLVNELKTCI